MRASRRINGLVAAQVVGIALSASGMALSQEAAPRSDRYSASVVCRQVPADVWELMISVRDRSGATIPGVAVTLAVDDVVRTETTDRTGAVVLRGTDTTEYSVRVELAGFDVASTHANVTPGCITTMLVPLTAAGEIYTVTVDITDVRQRILEGLATRDQACEAVFLLRWTRVREADKLRIGVVYVSDSFSDDLFDTWSDHPPIRRSSELPRTGGLAPPQFAEWIWSCGDPEPADDGYRFHAGYVCGITCGVRCDYYVYEASDGWAVDQLGLCSVS